MRTGIALAATALATGLFHTADAQDRGLAFWQDGKAELSSYALTQPRYGELHDGTAVLIFVTEPFSDRTRVKADPGHDASDVFPAFKLNLVKDFQTGIYDYNLMTSVFVALDPKDHRRAGAPAKMTFSGQEWCGNVFDELLFYGDRIDRKRFSYFDGEGDGEEKISYPKDAIAIDELLILVRSFPQPFLREGESKTLAVLGSLERARLLHRPLAFSEGTLTRPNGSERVTVPAGNFEVEVYSMALDGGERWTYSVEKAFPHRIIAWTGPDGEVAKLRGSERLKYWQLHGNKDEDQRARIGL